MSNRDDGRGASAVQRRGRPAGWHRTGGGTAASIKSTVGTGTETADLPVPAEPTRKRRRRPGLRQCGADGLDRLDDGAGGQVRGAQDLPVFWIPVLRFGLAALCLAAGRLGRGGLAAGSRGSAGGSAGGGPVRAGQPGVFSERHAAGPTSHVALFYATCPLVVLLLAWGCAWSGRIWAGSGACWPASPGSS